MTLIAILLVVYLVAAPDRATLAGTRGAAGALRAVLGMPAAGTRGRGKKSSSSHSKSSSRRPLLAGWREGVTAARKAREDGRDLWSRGSRAGGRVAGGTRNLVGGVRTTVRTRRDRQPSPDAQPVVASPDVDPASGKDDQVHAGLDQHLDDSGAPTWPADFKKAADLSGPAWPEADEARRQQDGELLFSSKTDDLGAAIGQPAHPEEKTEPDVSESIIGSPPAPTAQTTVDEVLGAASADSRYYVWTSPDSGQFFVFDRMNLDEPMPATDEYAAELWAGFYNSRHGLATQNGEPAAALADIPKTGGAGSPREDAFVITSLGPSGFEAPQTPTAISAAGNTNPSTTPRKETTPMAIAGTELGNLDEVDGEAKAALNAIEALTEALNEIKGWGGNLPDRWSGTAWGTEGLDAAIVGVAEASSELKIPEGLMEQLALIGEEVAKARTVGEAAAEARAKGDLSGFVSN